MSDQVELSKALAFICEKLRAPLPREIIADTGCDFRADFRQFSDVIFGRCLRLRIGMSATVGLSAEQFLGLLAHEFAFYSRGSGTISSWVIRHVHEWFELRIQHDPWLDILRERRLTGGFTKKVFFSLAWFVVWLSLLPLRLLYALCRLVSASVMQEMVLDADTCAANLIGSDAYAQALHHHALSLAHWTRHIMDSLEGVLRQFEGKLETRLACSLELLWRAEPASLPSRLVEVRTTLPHCMLIYEGLGMQLPLLRELMTHFSAFQALGAAVATVVDSASYYTTLQKSLPSVTNLVNEILQCLEATPYPFKTNWGDQGITLAQYLSPHASLDEIASPDSGHSPMDRRLLAQKQSKRLSEVVAPFIDRYLGLYHQSFAWVAKAADMAEWQFIRPPSPKTNRKTHNIQVQTSALAPPPKSSHDPKLAYGEKTRAYA